LNIPPYDNKEYHFRDDDSSAQAGRERVAALLGLPQAPHPDGLRFDLTSFSGGIGIYDKHAVVMNTDPDLWSTAKLHLAAKTPAEFSHDEAWSEEFNWLVRGDDDFPSIDSAAMSFINGQRKEFQDQCTHNMMVLFQACSNVNEVTACPKALANKASNPSSGSGGF
jgi:hypothetical protein